MFVVSKEHIYNVLTMGFKNNIVFVASNNAVTNFLFWIILMPHVAKVNDIALALD